MLYQIEMVIIITADDNNNPMIVFFIEPEHKIPWIIKITGNNKYIPDIIPLLYGYILSLYINTNINKLGNIIPNIFFTTHLSFHLDFIIINYR